MGNIIDTPTLEQFSIEPCFQVIASWNMPRVQLAITKFVVDPQVYYLDKEMIQELYLFIVDESKEHLRLENVHLQQQLTTIQESEQKDVDVTGNELLKTTNQNKQSRSFSSKRTGMFIDSTSQTRKSKFLNTTSDRFELYVFKSRKIQAVIRGFIVRRRLMRWKVYFHEESQGNKFQQREAHINELFAGFGRLGESVNPYEGIETIDALLVATTMVLMSNGTLVEKVNCLVVIFNISKRGNKSLTLQELGLLLVVCSNALSAMLRNVVTGSNPKFEATSFHSLAEHAMQLANADGTRASFVQPDLDPENDDDVSEVHQIGKEYINAIELKHWLLAQPRTALWLPCVCCGVYCQTFWLSNELMPYLVVYGRLGGIDKDIYESYGSLLYSDPTESGNQFKRITSDYIGLIPKYKNDELPRETIIEQYLVPSDRSKESPSGPIETFNASFRYSLSFLINTSSCDVLDTQSCATNPITLPTHYEIVFHRCNMLGATDQIATTGTFQLVVPYQRFSEFQRYEALNLLQMNQNCILELTNGEHNTNQENTTTKVCQSFASTLPLTVQLTRHFPVVSCKLNNIDQILEADFTAEDLCTWQPGDTIGLYESLAPHGVGVDEEGDSCIARVSVHEGSWRLNRVVFPASYLPHPSQRLFRFSNGSHLWLDQREENTILLTHKVFPITQFKVGEIIAIESHATSKRQTSSTRTCGEYSVLDENVRDFRQIWRPGNIIAFVAGTEIEEFTPGTQLREKDLQRLSTSEQSRVKLRVSLWGGGTRTLPETICMVPASSARKFALNSVGGKVVSNIELLTNNARVSLIPGAIDAARLCGAANTNSSSDQSKALKPIPMRDASVIYSGKYQFRYINSTDKSFRAIGPPFTFEPLQVYFRKFDGGQVGDVLICSIAMDCVWKPQLKGFFVGLYASDDPIIAEPKDELFVELEPKHFEDHEIKFQPYHGPFRGGAYEFRCFSCRGSSGKLIAKTNVGSVSPLVRFRNEKDAIVSETTLSLDCMFDLTELFWHDTDRIELVRKPNSELQVDENGNLLDSTKQSGATNSSTKFDPFAVAVEPKQHNDETLIESEPSNRVVTWRYVKWEVKRNHRIQIKLSDSLILQQMNITPGTSTVCMWRYWSTNQGKYVAASKTFRVTWCAPTVDSGVEYSSKIIRIQSMWRARIAQRLTSTLREEKAIKLAQRAAKQEKRTQALEELQQRLRKKNKALITDRESALEEKLLKLQEDDMNLKRKQDQLSEQQEEGIRRVIEEARLKTQQMLDDAKRIAEDLRRRSIIHQNAIVTKPLEHLLHKIGSRDPEGDIQANELVSFCKKTSLQFKDSSFPGKLSSLFAAPPTHGCGTQEDEGEYVSRIMNLEMAQRKINQSNLHNSSFRGRPSSSNGRSMRSIRSRKGKSARSFQVDPAASAEQGIKYLSLQEIFGKNGYQLFPESIHADKFSSVFFRDELDYIHVALGQLAKRPDILGDLFISHHAEYGLYGVRLYIDGCWQTVMVDDTFPCVQVPSTLLFVPKSTNQHSIHEQQQLTTQDITNDAQARATTSSSRILTAPLSGRSSEGQNTFQVVSDEVKELKTNDDNSNMDKANNDVIVPALSMSIPNHPQQLSSQHGNIGTQRADTNRSINSVSTVEQNHNILFEKSQSAFCLATTRSGCSTGQSIGDEKKNEKVEMIWVPIFTLCGLDKNGLDTVTSVQQLGTQGGCWGMVLEKAIAKTLGSFEAIASANAQTSTVEIFALVTGGAVWRKPLPLHLSDPNKTREHTETQEHGSTGSELVRKHTSNSNTKLLVELLGKHESTQLPFIAHQPVKDFVQLFQKLRGDTGTTYMIATRRIVGNETEIKVIERDNENKDVKVQSDEIDTARDDSSKQSSKMERKKTRARKLDNNSFKSTRNRSFNSTKSAEGSSFSIERNKEGTDDVFDVKVRKSVKTKTKNDNHKIFKESSITSDDSSKTSGTRSDVTQRERKHKNKTTAKKHLTGAVEKKGNATKKRRGPKRKKKNKDPEEECKDIISEDDPNHVSGDIARLEIAEDHKDSKEAQITSRPNTIQDVVQTLTPVSSKEMNFLVVDIRELPLPVEPRSWIHVRRVPVMLGILRTWRRLGQAFHAREASRRLEEAMRLRRLEQEREERIAAEKEAEAQAAAQAAAAEAAKLAPKASDKASRKRARDKKIQFGTSMRNLKTQKSMMTRSNTSKKHLLKRSQTGTSRKLDNSSRNITKNDHSDHNERKMLRKGVSVRDGSHLLNKQIISREHHSSQRSLTKSSTTRNIVRKVDEVNKQVLHETKATENLKLPTVIDKVEPIVASNSHGTHNKLTRSPTVSSTLRRQGSGLYPSMKQKISSSSRRSDISANTSKLDVTTSGTTHSTSRNAFAPGSQSSRTVSPSEHIDKSGNRIGDSFNRLGKSSRSGTVSRIVGRNRSEQVKKYPVRNEHYHLLPFCVASFKGSRDSRLATTAIVFKLRTLGNRFTWRGKWSDTSEMWSKESKQVAEFDPIGDGSFWMSLEDVQQHFASLSFAFTPIGANELQREKHVMQCNKQSNILSPGVSWRHELLPRHDPFEMFAKVTWTPGNACGLDQYIPDSLSLCENHVTVPIRPNPVIRLKIDSTFDSSFVEVIRPKSVTSGSSYPAVHVFVMDKGGFEVMQHVKVEGRHATEAIWIEWDKYLEEEQYVQLHFALQHAGVIGETNVRVRAARKPLPPIPATKYLKKGTGESQIPKLQATLLARKLPAKPETWETGMNIAVGLPSLSNAPAGNRKWNHDKCATCEEPTGNRYMDFLEIEGVRFHRRARCCACHFCHVPLKVPKHSECETQFGLQDQCREAEGFVGPEFPPYMQLEYFPTNDKSLSTSENSNGRWGMTCPTCWFSIHKYPCTICHDGFLDPKGNCENCAWLKELADANKCDYCGVALLFIPERFSGVTRRTKVGHIVHQECLAPYSDVRSKRCARCEQGIRVVDGHFSGKSVIVLDNKLIHVECA